MTESKQREPMMEDQTGSHTSKIMASPGGHEAVVVQIFEGPRVKVFRIYSDPKLLPEWWGPRYLKTTVEKMEFRPGGSWRVIQREPKGKEHGFHGVYHDVKAPERIVRTLEYEGTPGHVLLETTVFEERDGKTIVTNTSVFQSVEDRDGMMASGMEKGVLESEERFNELLAKTK